MNSIVESNLSKLIDPVINLLSDQIKHTVKSRILEYEDSMLQDNMFSKTIIHIEKPIKLTDFYQKLSLIERGKNEIDSPFLKNKIENIKEVFKYSNFITVAGNAGSGKTTLVRYLVTRSIFDNYKIPIKVELRYLNEEDGGILTYIKHHILQFNKIAESDSVIENMLSSGKFVFFLDGYDELITKRKSRITKSIEKMSKRYDKNSYFLTTRPYTDVELLYRFHNYDICRLTEDEILEFVQKQIPIEEKEVANKIIGAIKLKDNKVFGSFLETPLLLSMFILTFQSYADIPEKRSEFYGQVFDTLYSKHDSKSKLAFVREKVSGLSKDQFIDFLKYFCVISFLKQKFNFTKQYLYEEMNRIKSKRADLYFENDLLISDLQIALNILQKDGKQRFSFPHRSLQEYFAALFVSSLKDIQKEKVYRRISQSLIIENSEFDSDNNNFHLLLSELDKRGVIEYAILPFFKELNDFNKVDTFSAEIALSKFKGLHTLFDAFPSILVDNTIKIKHEEFTDILRNKISTIDRSSIGTDEYFIKVDEIQNDISLRVIIPYLKEFQKNIVGFTDELENYLAEEFSADDDFLSV